MTLGLVVEDALKAGIGGPGGRGRVLAPILAAILLGVCAVRAAAATPEDELDAAGLLAAGDSAYARLELDAATVLYRRAHGAAPGSYEATWKLTRVLTDAATMRTSAKEQRRLCEEAVPLARAAVALDPAGAKGHAYLAIALGRLALSVGGREKVRLAHEIAAEARRALALDPNDDVAHDVLGVWNREMAELPGVQRLFATVLYGRLPQASLDSAVVHLRAAVALRPEAVPHAVELGITLADERHDREAAAVLERALALPTGWVGDDVYRARARTALAAVRRRLR
jgi:tetratricopeptide (TPR) repeat protein